MKGVETAVAVGIRDEFLGEKVVSRVVVRDPASGPSADALRHYCRGEMSAEKLPDSIHLVETLPYGPSGMVELSKVRTLVEERKAGATASSRPSAPARTNTVPAASPAAAVGAIVPRGNDVDSINAVAGV